MERQQWMEALLRLHYGQQFSRGAACKQLGVNASTGYKFFQRFTQSGLSWPLPDEITAGELAKILYPSEMDPSHLKKSTSGKRRRANFTPEFRRHLAELALQPGVNIAQLAREYGINDNLLFNWRRQYQCGQNDNTPDAPVTLMPVDIAGSRCDIVDVTPGQSSLAEPDNTLCCEVLLPGGTLKLNGAVTPALLRMLFDELKEKQR